VAEDLINAVQYWSLPSIFSLWTLFKCQYHSSNSSSCFFCYNGQPLQIPACLYQATKTDNKLSWKPHVQNFDKKLSWKPHVHKVKTQLSRACGIISKLKHYTTPPVLKVVYNSLIHPYINYSILNWGSASNATIQPLIKHQNKAIKIINPTNTGSLEHFQHLNILCLPKLYSFSVGKFMHSASCFQIIFMNILFHLAQFIITPQD